MRSPLLLALILCYMVFRFAWAHSALIIQQGRKQGNSLEPIHIVTHTPSTTHTHFVTHAFSEKHVPSVTHALSMTHFLSVTHTPSVTKVFSVTHVPLRYMTFLRTLL